MPKNPDQIKFRVGDSVRRRVEWIMYREKLTQQELMLSALSEWLPEREKKWGPPPSDEPQVKDERGPAIVVPRKRVG